MIDALGDATRILHPAVRRGSLDRLERTGSRRRGTDTFVWRS
jgi:hypothetical protein